MYCLGATVFTINLSVIAIVVFQEGGYKAVPNIINNASISYFYPKDTQFSKSSYPVSYVKQ